MKAIAKYLGHNVQVREFTSAKTGKLEHMTDCSVSFWDDDAKAPCVMRIRMEQGQTDPVPSGISFGGLVSVVLSPKRDQWEDYYSIAGVELLTASEIAEWEAKERQKLKQAKS